MTVRTALVALTAATLATLAAYGCSSGGSGGGGGNGPGSTALANMPAAAVDTSTNVVAFASEGSAPKVFLLTAFPALAFGLSSSNCPTKTVNGNTTTLTGGCTDTQGTTFGGTIVENGITGPVASSGSIAYQGWSVTAQTSCGGMTYPGTTTMNGTVSLGGLSQVSFQSDVRFDVVSRNPANCAQTIGGTLAWSYAGTIARLSSNENMWAGSGTVGIASSASVPGFTPGKVSASTTSEDVNTSTCQYEALSGTTTIASAGHTSVITYDGATDCKQVSDAAWSLDGTSKGTLDGVGCEVGGGRSSPPVLLLFASGLALLLVRRTRSHRT